MRNTSSTLSLLASPTARKLYVTAAGRVRFQVDWYCGLTGQGRMKEKANTTLRQMNIESRNAAVRHPDSLAMPTLPAQPRPLGPPVSSCRPFRGSASVVWATESDITDLERDREREQDSERESKSQQARETASEREREKERERNSGSGRDERERTRVRETESETARERV